MRNTLESIQADIRNQISESPDLRGLDPKTALQHAVCGLTEEAGEVAGLLKRECYKNKYIPGERWVDELGDVLWYLVATATVLNIPLDEIWEYNHKKLEDRYGITNER